MSRECHRARHRKRETVRSGPIQSYNSPNHLSPNLKFVSARPRRGACSSGATDPRDPARRL